MTSRHERINQILRSYNQVRQNLTQEESIRVFTDGVADTIDSEFDNPPAPSIPMPEITPPSGTAPDYVSHPMRPNMVPAGYMFFTRAEQWHVAPRGWSVLVGRLFRTKQEALTEFDKVSNPFGRSNRIVRDIPYENHLNLKEVFTYA